MDEPAWLGLPGSERVRNGLAGLARGLLHEDALAVLIAAPRLQDLGFVVPRAVASGAVFEIQLYRLLEAKFPDEAHARYNAILREIDSFAAAADSLPRLLESQ